MWVESQVALSYSVLMCPKFHRSVSLLFSQTVLSFDDGLVGKECRKSRGGEGCDEGGQQVSVGVLRSTWNLVTV